MEATFISRVFKFTAFVDPNGRLQYLVEVGGIRLNDEGTPELVIDGKNRMQWDPSQFRMVISDDAAQGDLNVKAQPVETKEPLIVIPDMKFPGLKQ